MRPARGRWALATAGAVLVVLLVGGRWLAFDAAERAWAATFTGGAVLVEARALARLMRGLVLLLAVTWGTANLFFVYRAIGAVQMRGRLGDLEIVEAVPQRVLLLGVVGGGLLFGLVLALGTGDWWLLAALASRPVQFGASDPVLALDLGYYVSALPWRATLQAHALAAAVSACLVVALLYLGIGSLRFPGGRPVASPHARSHLGLLLACVAAVVAWGAVLDPAEVVGGLHGTMNWAALEVRASSAGFVTAVAVAAALTSLAWIWWDRPSVVVGGWAVVIVTVVVCYVILPAVARSSGRDATAGLAQRRAALEGMAFGATDAGSDGEKQPSPLPTPDAALAAMPLWDAEGVTARAGTRVAGVALRLGGGPAAPTWLAGLAPPALNPPGEGAPWAVLHRGPGARAGRALLAREVDSGLVVSPAPALDSTAWFGPGFDQFAVTAPDTWPATRRAGIPLEGWWRRSALAWTLQSPELARGETDGLVLLWRRDVLERLSRLAPFAEFGAATPLLADSALWWVSYGYVWSETFPLVRSLPWQGGPPVRYVRAGLVGAVHALSGETHLWLAPGYDSLTAAWARLFEPLIEPLDRMAPALRAQLPYPRELFPVAVAQVLRTRTDSETWTARAREPFELTAPGPERGSGVAWRRWTAQGFETGSPARFAALVAGAMSAVGPRLFVWRPAGAERLPASLVGSPQTKAGVLRLWLASGPGDEGRGDTGLLSVQGLFAEPASDGVPPHLMQVYLSWRDRVGQGATVRAALRDLAAGGLHAVPGDTSLAARWEAARRLAAQADSALAAGDVEGFGRLYEALKQLLGVGRRKLAPAPQRR